MLIFYVETVSAVFNFDMGKGRGTDVKFHSNSG